MSVFLKDSKLAMVKILSLLILVFINSACSMTMITDVFKSEDNEKDNMAMNGQALNGQIMENPFIQQNQPVADKPNKTEMELAESGFLMDGTMDRSMAHSPGMMQRPPQNNAVAVIPVPRSSYRPAYTHKGVGDYTEQMTMDLLQKTRHISPNSRIAVASFVDFSQSLQRTSILGNRLSESFMTELQSYGLSIVDFKVMESIQVTPQGDLFFDRSGPRGQMQFVLTGTMHRNERGVEVNVRIINIFDQIVVATTKGFIPHFIVSSLTPDYILSGGE